MPTTLDGDWWCEDGQNEYNENCEAVWQHCDECSDERPGLVPAGHGLDVDTQPYNMWYEHRDELRGKWDICGICTGSGGGYICLYHDCGEDDQGLDKGNNMSRVRKFYRTVITVEVLSEEPVSFDALSDVHHAITTGDCSGKWTSKTDTVDGPTMAKLLEAQGSDPSFFQLGEDND